MIGDNKAKQIYDITDVRTPLASGYEITFQFPDADSVRVYTTGNLTDTEVSASDYHVDTLGSTPKVVFSDGYSFPEGQTRLTVIRSLEYNQNLDLRNGDIIDADKLEDALDDITMQIQQVDEKVERAVLASMSDTVPIRIPEASSRANMLLGFDESGAALPVLTTEIEQKLAQALAAEESAISAKNAAENAQHEAEAARDASETAQGKAETAQASAETAEASAQALLDSIETKTEESIASINTAKTGAVGEVATQQATSVAAVQAAQGIAESDISGKRASALTSIDAARTNAVAAINAQKESSVAQAEREIVSNRDAALSDIQNARTNASNAITSQKDSSLQEIEQLASERKSEINTLAANQKADVKDYTDGVVSAAKTEVDEEKTTAVTAVQEEGASQVEAVRDVYQSDLALKSDKTETESLANELDDTKKKLAEQTLINARQSRQIENINYQLQDESIVHVRKMTGEDDDPAGTLSITSSKVFPYAEVDEIHGKTWTWNQLNYIKALSTDKKGLTISNVDEYTYRIVGTPTSTGNVNLFNTSPDVRTVVGHVYYLGGMKEASGIYLNKYIGTQLIDRGTGGVGVSTVSSGIGDPLRLVITATGVAVDITIRPFFVDLTTLFGVTESSQVTDWMKNWVRAYAEAHPQYDAGSLLPSLNVQIASSIFTHINYKKSRIASTGSLVDSDFNAVTDLMRVPVGEVLNVNVVSRNGKPVKFAVQEYSTSNARVLDSGFKTEATKYAMTTGYYIHLVIRYQDESPVSKGDFILLIGHGEQSSQIVPSDGGFKALDGSPLELKEGDVFDPFTGMLSESYGKIDLESIYFVYDPSITSWQSQNAPSDMAPISTSQVGDIISDRYTPATVGTVRNAVASIGYYSSNGNNYIRVNTGSASERPTGTILYKLAEPISPHKVAEPIDNGLRIESNSKITVACEDAQAEALIHYAIDNRSKA